MKTEQNHAIRNAAAWLESIAAMVAALTCDYARLDELRDLEEGKHLDGPELDELNELTKQANECDNEDTARERLQESPLSVQVRGGWYSPGSTPSSARAEPEEFEILLSTGGPALRIIGELDEHGQPTDCLMQWQDWGTPWTNYLNDSDENSLLKFCQQFYFGE